MKTNILIALTINTLSFSLIFGMNPEAKTQDTTDKLPQPFLYKIEVKNNPQYFFVSSDSDLRRYLSKERCISPAHQSQEPTAAKDPIIEAKELLELSNWMKEHYPAKQYSLIYWAE